MPYPCFLEGEKGPISVEVHCLSRLVSVTHLTKESRREKNLLKMSSKIRILHSRVVKILLST